MYEIVFTGNDAYEVISEVDTQSRGVTLYRAFGSLL